MPFLGERDVFIDGAEFGGGEDGIGLGGCGGLDVVAGGDGEAQEDVEGCAAG